MTMIAITRNSGSRAEVPVFKELSSRLEGVRQRAFELFQARGGIEGHELEDWLTAEREVLGWPAAELKERDGEYEMEVSLAGFSPSEIDLAAADDELVVHAATHRQSSGGNEKVVWSQFGSNDVFRHVTLPEMIDTESVSARYDNGLLRITAHKAAHALATA